MNVGAWLFLLDFALVFYVLGAAYVEGFVNYRTWHLIGPAEFPVYHRAVGPKIIEFLAAPHSLTVVLTLALLWWRPPAIPLWAIWISIVLNVVPLMVTAFSQVPIQLEFDRSGMSPSALHRLVRREWLRSIPHGLNALLFIWAMSRVI
jgi:hypothetical protein